MAFYEKTLTKKAALTSPGAALDDETLQSVTIDFLRFPLALAVVFIHSAYCPEYEAPDFSRLGGMDFFNLLRLCVSRVIAQIAVPGFFLISGFLYFRKVERFTKDVWKRKTKSRLYTLVVPYLLWNVVALFSGGSLKHLWARSDYGRFLWDSVKGLEDIPTIFGESLPLFPRLSYPLDYPLWFLRDLICVSLLSPVVWFLVKRGRWWGVALLGVCYVGNLLPLTPGLSVTALFWFSFGACFSVRGLNLVVELRRREWLLGALSLALFLLVVYAGLQGVRPLPFPVYSFFVLFFTLFAFCLASRLVRRGARPNRLLLDSCFTIYALHTIFPVRTSVTLLEKAVPSQSPLACSVKYLLVPVLAVAMCVAVQWGLGKVSPRLLALMTGRRGKR